MEVLNFNGYQGTVETSVADGVLYGKILFITDLVTYEAETLAQLKAAFEEAVTDYLATCKEVGKKPDKPCSGQFNVRVSAQLHRRALLRSVHDDVSLNAVVVEALEAHLSDAKPYSMVKSVVFNVTVQEQKTSSTGIADFEFFRAQTYGINSTATH